MSRWPVDPPSACDLTPRPTLFLDRDGVVVVEKDYLSDPGQVTLEAGVADALRRARDAGYQLVGVSNQSGLGRGRFGPEELAAVMTRLDEIMAAAGCPLDAFFYCPHAPDDGCRCRKPRLGLLEEAWRERRWDPARSWVIGDKVSDVDLAAAAGLHGGPRPHRSRREQEARLGDRRVLVCDDLAAVIAHILKDGS